MSDIGFDWAWYEIVLILLLIGWRLRFGVRSTDEMLAHTWTRVAAAPIPISSW